MDINDIKEKIQINDYEISLHALEKSFERKIWKDDIEHAIMNGEIIEDYKDDKPYPSCLICGKTRDMQPIHIVCTYPPIVRIITIYFPDKDKWIDYKIRIK
ncbi:MAG: hypothetical protein CVT88_00135 [Candidatus Altiarchaeales archaeon HGW-Altiarchaeales-1]|nr:MAG: hypothetical protein CVT89_07025 [Candidatus Altiarchaeales archaeon HGW-Altiarchaeales-2]PKP61435.1 MAG: hypothetical protein CVT88_00135 [Candidatus Altiarchaeales archaeon HGW-Altiarchaeales-1]